MNGIGKLALLKFITIIFCLFLVVFITGCKKETNNNLIETATVADIDGNVYKTVKIGKQWWMAENLKVKKYRNGDTITFIGTKNKYSSEFDSSKWVNINSGAYCIFNSSKDSTDANFQGKKYGLLYNWYATHDSRNIAPSGWHVPTDEEWKELEIFIGMPKDTADKLSWRGNNEGNKLKLQRVKKSDATWNTPSDQYEVWGTNESGFTALAGGCCMFYGVQVPPASTGFWWTASQHDTLAWYRYLDYNKANVFRYYGPLTYGFSIRCVKD
jgi:uncharacterized protein (TIGR02145 family)